MEGVRIGGPLKGYRRCDRAGVRGRCERVGSWGGQERVGRTGWEGECDVDVCLAVDVCFDVVALPFSCT